jgi:serine/threonine protein kinase
VSSLRASPSLPLHLSKDSPQAAASVNSIITSLRYIAAEIALGLLFLHNKGIVHQDLKPANILISYEGHAIIGDFGAASQCQRFQPHRGLPTAQTHPTSSNCEFEPITLSPTDYVTFTPLYAAPELRHRNQQGLVVYDLRSDWWSFGVILHELATGLVPFNSIIETDRSAVAGAWRRSEGDHSLSYGEIEILEDLFNVEGSEEVKDSIMLFGDLLRCVSGL